MAIEVGSKKKKDIRAPKGFNVLFYFSILLFLFAVSSYFVIDHIQKETESEIEAMENEIRDMEAAVDNFDNMEDKVIEYERIINDYIRLMEERRVLSSLLDLLEDSTHSLAQIREISVDTGEGTVTMEGVAQNLQVLEQQHHIYKNISLAYEEEVLDDPIREVRLASLSELDENDRVSFEFRLLLSEEIFTK